MSVKYVECDREIQYLFPSSFQDWLPEVHLARFVVELVELLDLRSLKESYAGRGSQPYNPEMLLALLFYVYATGVPSSRKHERSTYDSSLSAMWRQIRILGQHCHVSAEVRGSFAR